MANNNGPIESLVWKSYVDQLPDKIKKACSKLNVPFELSDPIKSESDEWVAFPVTPKRSSTISRLRDRLPDIGDRVGADLYLEGSDHRYFIIVRNRNVKIPSLTEALRMSLEECRNMKLPYVAGVDVLNQPVLCDLAESPHVLLGGSSGSGKSVGLNALVSSICLVKQPSEVEFVLIDVGVSGLTNFNKLPHLSCPVITTVDSAYRALCYVRDEMESRIKLKGSDPRTFDSLPSLVLVIDEFPALIQIGDAAGKLKELTTVISSMLQRGRHAKLHLVISAQNPTMQHTRVDLSNITTRMAFRCAKKNFSETILGEPGAEKLRGKGELLFKSPKYDAPKHLKGIYISPDELKRMVLYMEKHYSLSDCSHQFTIPDDVLIAPEDSPVDSLSGCPSVSPKVSREVSQLASAILWAFQRDLASINALQGDGRHGFSTARSLISRMEELGIVSEAKGKLQRSVIPTEIADLPSDLISFLASAGISEADISKAFANRRDSSDISVR